MRSSAPTRFAAVVTLLLAPVALAGAGDVQVKTDHPWYPGELACSTFARLFATQAELYKRVTGRAVVTDEDKALASWLWRNTHYAHGEAGRCDVFSAGFARAEWNRDYWTGLFAHGFALCGTTHAQWTAEMNALLGHGRGRVVGVSGHNSFEVYLTGGAYGAGRWALLDHDVSTVIFAPDGSRLLSIQEIAADLKTLRNPRFSPERQRGWRVAGLHDDDAGVFDSFRSVEYLAGYAGPPPQVHLRRGETLRRYLNPGLEDGRTFVFWGRNYMAGGIPGPERSRTWVNQPEKVFGSKDGSGYRLGQVRYANAVFEYAPDFASAAYKEGVVEEAADSVTFEFRSPYVIAATPPNDKPWGIYDAGGTNGLVVRNAPCAVSVSTDGGRTFVERAAASTIDLTDAVKGRYQYLLRFHAPASSLAGKGVSWRTVCQANVSVIPRLKEGANRITFLAGGAAIVSAGPTLAQATARLVEGSLPGPTATLELVAPRGARPVHVYAASWNSSGNPPQPAAYRIDISADGGRTWTPAAKDWTIVRRPPEPADFWSQSFCWGDAPVGPGVTAGTPIRVRFSNTGRRSYRKVEAHLAYAVTDRSPVKVTFAWKEGGAIRTASHTYPAAAQGKEDASWSLTTGRSPETLWVEYAAP